MIYFFTLVLVLRIYLYSCLVCCHVITQTLADINYTLLILFYNIVDNLLYAQNSLWLECLASNCSYMWFWLFWLYHFPTILKGERLLTTMWLNCTLHQHASLAKCKCYQQINKTLIILKWKTLNLLTTSHNNKKATRQLILKWKTPNLLTTITKKQQGNRKQNNYKPMHHHFDYIRSNVSSPGRGLIKDHIYLYTVFGLILELTKV